MKKLYWALVVLLLMLLRAPAMNPIIRLLLAYSLRAPVPTNRVRLTQA